MKQQIKNLVEFQTKFNGIVNNSPSLISKDEYLLRYNLSLEELNEYKDACEDNDIVEIFDAILDRIFLAIGDAVIHGLQDKLIDGFQEVFRSNMSKLDSNGKPIINGKNGILDGSRPLGKVLKSKGYSEPNIKQFL
jgi:predicted HAD superfamily Cof-like phosphohydrolase